MRRRAATLAALAVVVSSMAAAAAEASFPGRNGRIAYSSLPVDGTPRAIHTMTVTGERDRRLTRRGSARNPAWSANGRLIAFDATRANGKGPSRLYVMRANGRKKRRVPTRRLDARNPAWSPNGRWLAFEGCRRSSECEERSIFAVRRRGSKLRRIAPAGSDPVWAPNGRRIAYAGKLREGGCTTIVLVRPTGRGRHAVLPDAPDEDGFCAGASGIDFAPDSRRLAYLALRARRTDTFRDPITGETHHRYAFDHVLYTVALGGEGQRLVTWRSIEDYRYLIGPFAWSPDGTRLLWSDDRATFLTRPDGSGRRRIRGPNAGSGDYAWQPLRRRG